VAQLRREKDRFEKAGAGILLVGMGSPAECADFKQKFDIPFDLVSDPEKKLYQVFGLKAMAPWQVLSPALALKGLAAIGRGHGLGKPVGDVRQLPGVFVIDTEGRIVYNRPADNAAGHPSAEEILEVLQRSLNPGKSYQK
jgi:peroxiredoxin